MFSIISFEGGWVATENKERGRRSCKVASYEAAVTWVRAQAGVVCDSRGHVVLV